MFLKNTDAYVFLFLVDFTKTNRMPWGIVTKFSLGKRSFSFSWKRSTIAVEVSNLDVS